MQLQVPPVEAGYVGKMFPPLVLSHDDLHTGGYIGDGASTCITYRACHMAASRVGRAPVDDSEDAITAAEEATTLRQRIADFRL
jgi:hypothetical protein